MQLPWCGWRSISTYNGIIKEGTQINFPFLCDFQLFSLNFCWCLVNIDKTFLLQIDHIQFNVVAMFKKVKTDTSRALFESIQNGSHEKIWREYSWSVCLTIPADIFYNVIWSAFYKTEVPCVFIHHSDQTGALRMHS